MSKSTKHKGRHTHRFKDNPEERRFAEAWAKDNEQGHTLAYLLDRQHGTGPGKPPEPDDLEREVAATVVQWLGSPMGQCFLRDLGYTRRP